MLLKKRDTISQLCFLEKKRRRGDRKKEGGSITDTHAFPTSLQVTSFSTFRKPHQKSSCHGTTSAEGVSTLPCTLMFIYPCDPHLLNNFKAPLQSTAHRLDTLLWFLSKNFTDKLLLQETKSYTLKCKCVISTHAPVLV